MLRHLPPTTTPLSLADLGGSLTGATQAPTHFQAALSDYLGHPVCGLAASARTALFVLLDCLRAAADSPTRREVLLPAYTCPALVKVIRDTTLRPRLVDISPRTLIFEESHLTATLSERTLALIWVHPFGLPQDVDLGLRLAAEVGAVVIEDAAQALGAGIGGQPVGTRGDFGLFSLGPGKPMSTGGGGFVCARHNDSLSQRVTEALARLPGPPPSASGLALLRLLALRLLFHPAGWWLATRARIERLGAKESSWGYQHRSLTGLQAGVGRRLLPHLAAINHQRRDNAERLLAHLQAVEGLHVPPLPPAAEPIYLRLPLLVGDMARRERLFEALWRSGIGVGKMYGRSLAEIFPRLATKPFPGAEAMARQLLTLPTHHYVQAADVKRISRIVGAI